MKFRATFRRGSLGPLLAIVRGLSRFEGGVCSNAYTTNVHSYVKITPSNVFLTVRTQNCSDAYVELRTDGLFEANDFILESKRQNNIALQIEFHTLADILRFCQKGDSVTVKLSKREGQAVLSFEFREMDPSNRVSLSVTKECPVETLLKRDSQEASPPEIPPTEWCFTLSPAKTLLNVFENIRQIGTQELCIQVQCQVDTAERPIPEGTVRISASTSSVTIQSASKAADLTFDDKLLPRRTSTMKVLKLPQLIHVMKLLAASVTPPSEDVRIITCIPENDDWTVFAISLEQSQAGPFRLFCVAHAKDAEMV